MGLDVIPLAFIALAIRGRRSGCSRKDTSGHFSFSNMSARSGRFKEAVRVCLDTTALRFTKAESLPEDDATNMTCASDLFIEEIQQRVWQVKDYTMLAEINHENSSNSG
ncbi:hypothetical protein NKH86_11905 [Mesorhizobium sp. M0913]